MGKGAELPLLIVMQSRFGILPLSLKADGAEGGVGVPVFGSGRFIGEGEPVVIFLGALLPDGFGAQTAPRVVIGGPEEGASFRDNFLRGAEVFVGRVSEKVPARD